MLLATVSMACGPDFPQAFLPYRNELLKAPIKGDFAFELGRYSAAIRARTAALQAREIESLKAWRQSMEAPSYRQPEDKSAFAQRVKAEAKGVTSAQNRQIQRMRLAKDGDKAYAVGQGLPEAIRLYTAAATDFQLAKRMACAGKVNQRPPYEPIAYDESTCNRDWCKEDCYPDRVKLLAANPAIHRAIKRFELVLALPHRDSRPRATWAAYSLAEAYLNFKLDNRQTKAYEYYEQVRKLARQGVPDPLDLANSSLGQQAFLKLQVGANADAITLYLEQGEVNSLRRVAERLISQPDKLELELKAQPVRRLLVAYAFAYAASEHQIRNPQGLVNQLAKSLIAADAAGAEDMDRLAAISYENGNFQQAAQLAERSKTPLAHWVKSKLARRSGNTKLAAEHLAMATSDRTALRNSLPAAACDLLGTESAAVMLEKGNPTDAIAGLFAMGGKRWPDIAYIAERVLTTKELRAFVDGIPAETAQAVPPADIQGLTETQLAVRYGYRTTGESTGDMEALDAPIQLRNLLARRLMRDGQHTIALRYFVATDRPAAGPAKEYAAALRTSKYAINPTTKAEALFKAGKLARMHGMDFLGYELAPDFHYTKGNYVSDYVRGVVTPGDSSSLNYGKTAVSPNEASRFNASAPMIDKRYHYRYLAVKHGLNAANLLPARSQAYRAVLCHATSWAPEEGLKADLYRTYVRNGSMMNFPLSGLFGRTCETPDFERVLHQRVKLKPGQR